MARGVHVISPAGGTGNRIDLELVCPLLRENGFEVTAYPVADRRRKALYGKVLRHLLSLRGRFAINLFMGPLFPEWLPFAPMNIWMPNPEGFHEHQRKYLPRIDLVLAKTRQAERIFRELGRRTEFVGFTSRDHFDSQVPRDPTRFFHARSSSFKGTVRLLETWQAHPDWPELVAVISDETVLPDLQADNIRIIRRYISDAELRRLQNEITFHVCCSEAEGFGHYIMEALSCGAVVLTTNGPPMNELVQPSRGILLDCLEEKPPLGLSHRHYFDPASLEREVARARNLDEASCHRLGTAARAYYLENDVAFRRRFIEVMREL